MSKYVYLYKVDYLEKSNIYKFGTIEDKTMIKNIQSNNPNKLTILKNSNVIFHMLVDNLTNIIKDKIINIFKTTFIFHKNEYYEGNYKQMIDIIYCIITNENITPNLIKNINEDENQKINYIYLLIEREFISLNKNIYKIGRSERKNYTRFVQYSNNSVLLFQIKCNDCKKMENIIVNIFKNNFVRQVEIGNEYFEGDYKKMISLMYDAVKNENILTTIEIPSIDKELLKKIQIEKNINNNQLFINYCCEKNVRKDIQYNYIHNKMKKLGIHKENKEIFDKFINIIKTDKEIIKHQNLIKILKKKTIDINDNNNKISLIKKIENDNNISILNLNFNEEDSVIIDDLVYECLKSKFDSVKKKPTDKHSLKVFYISMLKNLCNGIIFSKASNKIINHKRKKITKYFLNMDTIKLSLELEKYSNPKIYEEIIFDNLIM